jgi:methylphosphotriester-DNA--protein-cysteine methyltransferase
MPPATVDPPFFTLLEQLCVRVVGRIAQGEVTERALARQAGISQSHLHNVLKGIRGMTPELADRLMVALGWKLGDLGT